MFPLSPRSEKVVGVEVSAPGTLRRVWATFLHKIEEEATYLRRFAHAAVPVFFSPLDGCFRLGECEIRTRLDLVIVI